MEKKTGVLLLLTFVPFVFVVYSIFSAGFARKEEDALKHLLSCFILLCIIMLVCMVNELLIIHERQERRNTGDQLVVDTRNVLLLALLAHVSSESKQEDNEDPADPITHCESSNVATMGQSISFKHQ